MEKKIITISREFGAGGRTIGHIVADKLGIPFYDGKFVEEHSEHSPSGSVFSYAFAPQGVPGIMNGLSTADYLWNAQCNVILQLADKGPCVIVGRNADYILKDRADALHIYVSADQEFREKHIVELYGETDKTPEQRLNEKDKRRRVNYQHYTGRIWGQAQNYDLCLRSSTLGFDQCAQIIINAIEQSKEK